MADADRFHEIDALFSRALALEPAARRDFVAARCGGDGELRAAVERLLAAAEQEETDATLRPGGALDEGLWTALAGDVEGRAGAAGREALAPGERVGPYRVEGEIGRGGMAVVYRAERVDGGFAQRVALKVLKRGTDTDEVLRRFAQERQILATLDHPDIARLLDGGATADGRPYFALELVEGEPIDRWCDARGLSLRRRLRLFLGVCRAVQHAHRRLVVHRDLKPSNILVTTEGRVKLLDFGIAKLADPEPWPEVAPPTRTTLRVLTPEYASPEQVRGEPVTPATDVYQLGLLLYELLTGQRAIRVDRGGRQALERAICEQEPTPPSTAVTRPEAAAAGTPSERERRSRLRRLRRSLRGDLDNIVLMALRKEPDRRYGSAGELAADIERYLDGEPVGARKDTLGYRAAKFARRHRWALAAAAAVVLAAVALTAVYTVGLARERDRARQQAERSARVAQALSELFRLADPERARAESIPVRELLDRGVETIERDLAGEPDLRATMLRELGRAYLDLGLHERGVELFEESLRLHQALYGDDHPETAEALSGLGLARYRAGDLEAARPLLERALAIRERAAAAGEADPLALSSSYDRLANLNKRTGDLEAARAQSERAVALAVSALGPDHERVGRVRNNYGLVLDAMGDTRGALRELEASLAILERVFGPDHPRVAATLGNLVLKRQRLGDHAGALAGAERAIVILEGSYGPEHPTTAEAYTSLGLVLGDAGDHERAREMLAISLARYEAALGPEHHLIAYPLVNLGRELRRLGRHDEAWPLYERALALRVAQLGPAHSLVGLVLAHQGEWFEETGDRERAEERFRRALAIRRAALPAGHRAIGDNLAALGGLLADGGDCGAARPLLAEAVAILSPLGPPDTRRLPGAEAALARCPEPGG